jgi:hypothetical protein
MTPLKSIHFFLSLSALFFGGVAQAVSEQKIDKDYIYFDYANQNLVVYGVYKPGTEPPKRGLSAEMDARSDGFKNLQDFIDGNCKKPEGVKESNWHGTASGGWRGYIKSLGSDIFPQSVLRIHLIVDMNKVFPKLARAKLADAKTADGKRLTFKIPELPGIMTQCGAAKLDLGNGKFLSVVPLKKSAGSDTPVTLVLDNTGTLKASTPEEQKLLESSSLSTLVAEGGEAGGTSLVGIPLSK